MNSICPCCNLAMCIMSISSLEFVVLIEDTIKVIVSYLM